MIEKTYRVVEHPRLKRDYADRVVRTKRDLTNGWGVVPAGSVGTIKYQSPKGSDIFFEPCDCCGRKARISRVSMHDIEFVEEE